MYIFKNQSFDILNLRSLPHGGSNLSTFSKCINISML